MDIKFLDILRCPACYNKLRCQPTEVNEKNHISSGILKCDPCNKNYPIINGIPRFVPQENYAASFGYQWNLYKHTQVDDYSQSQQSAKRFYSETGWSQEDLNNNWVLDAGCGNGRFIDICSRNDCQVVGVDISTAIDAAKELFRDRDNVHLVQASLYALPFAKGYFDKCYSIGVIQHTPNPKKALKALPQFVKRTGTIAVTIYERKPWTMLYSKYWLRPLTRRINQKALLSTIKLLSPIFFPLTEVLFRIPILNKVFKFTIPYANYVEKKDLTMKQRYEWAILDTFDMLSPAFDNPMTEKSVRNCLQELNLKNIERLPNPGINITAVR